MVRFKDPHVSACMVTVHLQHGSHFQIFKLLFSNKVIFYYLKNSFNNSNRFVSKEVKSFVQVKKLYFFVNFGAIYNHESIIKGKKTLFVTTLHHTSGLLKVSKVLVSFL